MRNYKNIIRACLLYALVVITATGYPLTALAASADPSATSSTSETATAPPKESYIYNPETNHWDSTKWQYDPATNTYQRPPAPAPPIITTPETPVVAGAGNQAPAVATSPSSTTTTTEPVTSTDANQGTTAGVGNTLTSQAQTGDASVATNTTGGNATSGDAAATTTIVNTVHSTIQGDTAGVAHFSADINGNVVGDITLSPSLNAALDSSKTAPLTTAVQVDQSTGLTNNISLGATSGNANVSNNTSAGNATTGTANTVANIVNLINSIIAANKSFVGTINIYGNLDGDILISPSFIPQLLASNAPTTTSSPLTTSSALGVNDTQSIINNVTLNAASGSANVANNTAAGSATTGTAATNLTILNYSGHQVVASNSLLIFVNVLGRWVGVIVDAPVGATAAVLGNGVTSNTSSGSNQAVNATTTSGITNNIDLTSLSGDATVQGNTRAGNATSGNATASANIANISTSSFSLSDWFGVLFINVFGTWYGSFGVDTANGTVTPITGGSIPSASSDAPVTTASIPQFGFVPRTSSSQASMVPDTTDSPLDGLTVETAGALRTTQPSVVEGDGPTTISEAPQPNPSSAIMIIASLIGAVLAAGIGLYRK